MSQFFAYVCVRTTNDPFIPSRASDVNRLSRDVSDAFSALSGGRLEVGRLALYPVQRSVPNHLLCDGREVSQTDFPELYRYLGDSEGAAAAGMFKLPSYLTTFAPATTAAVETVTSGTVTTPPPAVPPSTSYPEQEEQMWGDVDSGGKPMRYIP